SSPREAGVFGTVTRMRPPTLSSTRAAASSTVSQRSVGGRRLCSTASISRLSMQYPLSLVLFAAVTGQALPYAQRATAGSITDMRCEAMYSLHAGVRKTSRRSPRSRPQGLFIIITVLIFTVLEPPHSPDCGDDHTRTGR